MTDPTPDQYAPTETLAPPAKGSRKGLFIGAGAAVLVAVGGAAVWAAAQLSGGGTQPEALVPKSAFAYVKIDLDPAANQKLAARSYFRKFPQLKTNDDGDVFEDVLASVVNDEDVSYERDVKPWFDKRIGIAAFPGAGGKAQVVTVLRSKDDDAAKASFDRIVADAKADGEDVAYQVRRGYVVVGKPAAVGDAVRLTENESLGDNEVYRDDVERLDGDQVAVAWADLGQGYDAVKAFIPGAGLLPGALSDQVKGRVVAGIHLTDNYAEVQGFSVDANTAVAPKVPASTEVLRSLPADTQAAISLNGIATGAKEAGGAFDLDRLLGQYLQGSGLSFENDIAPTLGDETVIAAGSLSLAAPRVGIVSKTTSAESAKSTGGKAAAILSFLGVDASADVHGDRFVLATPGDYAEALGNADGGLGRAPRFQQAMGDLDGVAFAAYVDVNGLRATPFGSRLERGLAAFGLVTGVRGEEAFFRLRAVAE